MGKHLDLDDRIEIQIGLKEGRTFTDIAVRIGRDKSTVSREVSARRYFVHHKEVTTSQINNVCIHRLECNIKENCKSPTCFKRSRNCITCGKCNDFCKSFEEEICGRTDKAPFVCNGCGKKPKCALSKWFYDAKTADDGYKSTLSCSRSGISLNEAELERLDKVVSPLLKKGQSVRYICSHKSDELIVSDKTIYKYLGQGLLCADLFDLKRKVQRKARKKAGPVKLADKKCRIGRLYEDFKGYMDSNADKAVVEMDTVEGKKGGKVMLTLFFNNSNLQLGFLREHNDAASVSEIFRKLRDTLDRPDDFTKLFSTVLTDRGSEFSDPEKVEIDFDTSEIQGKVFYCDPQNTNQKSRCERNHEFIRYVIPKGTALDDFTQDDVNTMMDHINSYGREKFNFKSPLDIFEGIYGAEIVKKLGIKRIPAEDICLTPKLLKK